MPEFTQRFSLDLPDTLASHLKVLSYFLECMVSGLADSKSLAQDEA